MEKYRILLLIYKMVALCEKKKRENNQKYFRRTDRHKIIGKHTTILWRTSIIPQTISTRKGFSLQDQ